MEIADVMAIIGVLAPSMPTRRMEEVFSKKLLHALTKSTVELPDMDFDDNAMMKAVRCLNMSVTEGMKLSVGENE
ncbi:hypothetical protein BGZ88_003655 [Linnemannia elongata]|nr:hypothetical protein BGZ88_003655 [Linnemannia elongata]